MRYQYCLAYDDGNILIRRGLERGVDGHYPLDRFDAIVKDWVDDPNIGGIYSGDIPVDVISEDEVQRRIAQITG